MNDNITAENRKNMFPPKEELPIDEEGNRIPPDGIVVYKNGAGAYDKRIVYGPGTFADDPNAFDTEKAHEAHLAKIHKQEQRLIEAIEEKTKMPADIAHAKAGAILFDQIVMGHSEQTFGGRERVDAWEKIGQKMGLLPDKQKAAAEGRMNQGDVGVIPVELAREVRKILELRASLQGQDSVESTSEAQTPVQIPAPRSDKTHRDPRVPKLGERPRASESPAEQTDTGHGQS